MESVIEVINAIHKKLRELEGQKKLKGRDFFE